MNTPEIGSKWQIGNEPFPQVVVNVRKLGRGYQVETEWDGAAAAIGYKHRLRDFLKAAKPL